ncbi:MAG: quinolinate synthase NadA [Deltaproteobacteria bacterium]|nr:quinolinate synthase NadA [Candidatus Anaeroferrophillus wilburensis]MBN2889678.1 quinolinate synthase NadA [Deltaproteobacteria bacterium]
MDKQTLISEIQQLKQKRRAVILAHNYEPGEIQEIADITGDSLGLSIQAAATDAEVIVFCGVLFMAESAAILSPEKKVLLPYRECGCGLADMATAEQVIAARRRHPGAAVVTYVNSSAAVKAESDICCTSGNAVNVVNSIPREQEIIFVPDQNLGSYVMAQTKRSLILWPGYCPVHHTIRATEILAAKKRHPQAIVIVHPECRPEVTALADVVCSTGGMFDAVAAADAREFIIGTEAGMLHPLQKAHPDRRFHPVTSTMICHDMKKITLAHIHQSLTTMEPVITVDPAIGQKARTALERMLAVPRS